MKKIALYHHWDKNNIVDDYSIYTIKSLVDFGFEVIFSSNSNLADGEKEKLSALVKNIITRSNKGFDFGAWKQVLTTYKETVLECEHLLLLNNSCFGPVVPLQESFDKMQTFDADYWGMSSCEKHPVTPDHLYSYFICFTNRVIRSEAFWNFWENEVRDYENFMDAVHEAEWGLTKALKKGGFRYRTITEMPDADPIPEIGYREAFSLYSADYLVHRYRTPFVKIKAFAHRNDAPFNPGGLIIDSIKKVNPDFPVEHIYNYLNRTQPLSWQKNLPERTRHFPLNTPVKLPEKQLRFAVITHVFYVDVLKTLSTYLRNIPIHFTLLISTTTEKDKNDILEYLRSSQINATPIVRVVKNHGRDIYPWLSAFNDLQGDFDLCLKIHTKKSADLPEVFGFKWFNFLMDSLLGSSGYISNIFNTFSADKNLGIVFPHCPPLVKLYSPKAIYEDTVLRDKFLDMLKISSRGDEPISIFPVGTMFYYRPEAMKKLFDADIPQDIFPPEPFPVSGTMAHGLERALPYIVQDAGYTFNYCIPDELIFSSLRIYEDRISSLQKIYTCYFDLYHTSPGTGFSENKKIVKIIQNNHYTFVFNIPPGAVEPKDSLWRIDFGSSGEVFRISDIRFMTENRECLISARKNPEFFNWYNCVKKNDGDSILFVPVNDDPQIHMTFPDNIVPTDISCIYFEMIFEDTKPYSVKYFETDSLLNAQISRNQELQGDINCKTEEINSLHACVTEKDASIQLLQNDISEKENKIYAMQNDISEKQSFIASLQENIADKDKKFAELRRYADELESELRKIYNTKLWRWSSPIRKIIAFLRRKK